MKQLQRLITSIGVLAVALATGQTAAYEAGDIILRAGIVSVQPNDDSSALNLEGSELANTGVEVEDDTQAMLTITYMVNPHFGLELLASTPFEHEINTQGLAGLNGLNLSDVELGTVEHLPPSLSLAWYPLGSGSDFQPFVGAGVNYWLVLDEDVSSAAASALGAANLSLDDSVGLELRAGFDYTINENWSFNAGLWYIDIATDASVDTALGTITVDVDVDPWVYGVGLGFTF